MNEDFKNLTLKELADEYLLSVRAINVCEKIGLLNLDAICRFYRDNESFLKIRNCGRKSNDELIELCEKQIVLSKKTVPDFKRDKKEDSINQLNPFKRLTLNKYVAYNFKELNVRTQNGITSFTKSDNPKDIIEKVFLLDFDFRKVQHIGEKTVKEIEEFKILVGKFILELNTMQNESISKEYLKIILRTWFKNLPKSFDNDVEQIIDQTGKIKLFKLLDYLIHSNTLFNENESEIFEGTYFFHESQKVSLDTIAAAINLTRERVRQIRYKLEDKMKSKFNFLFNFSIEDFVNYDFNLESTHKTISQDFLEKINLIEEVNFNQEFYAFIFNHISKNNFVLINSAIVDDKARNKKRNQKLRNSYLISKEIIENFCFTDLIEDISSILNSKIEEDFSLHFEGYLSQFAPSTKTNSNLSDIKIIVENILLYEFDLVVSFDGYLEFYRNSKPQLQKYAEEILSEKQVIMKVDDIVFAINEKYPELEVNTSQLRSALQKNKKTFSSVGRMSTYGLRSWEKEQKNFKGGTIRNIVEEYLNNCNEPKHISEIFEYVKKFRANTNIRSVLTNIEIAEKNNFHFFQGDFIGLKNKNYLVDEQNYKRINGIHFITRMLKKINGFNFEDGVNYYVSEFGYSEIQIKHLLLKKVEDGYIELTKENKIKV